jgi:hypothetical protein
MSLIGRLWSLFRPRQLEANLDDELRFHIDMRVQEKIAEGIQPEEARSQVLRRFGNRTWIKEETRAINTIGWLEILRQDLHYGWRMLRRSPGFTAIAVLSLGLGIGVNSSGFSVGSFHRVSGISLSRRPRAYQTAEHACPAFESAAGVLARFSGCRARQPKFRGYGSAL